MLDAQTTIIRSAGNCGRANRKDGAELARRRYQTGCLFIRGKRTKKWIARWREAMISADGTIREVQRSEGDRVTQRTQQIKSAGNSKRKTQNDQFRRP